MVYGFLYATTQQQEIPLYFLWKMYVEFVLGKHVNYFDILSFQGIGGGMPQNRPNARLRDVDRPIPAPRKQLPGPDVPPVHLLFHRHVRQF